MDWCGGFVQGRDREEQLQMLHFGRCGGLVQDGAAMEEPEFAEFG
jgi:hypothetical protein